MCVHPLTTNYVNGINRCVFRNRKRNLQNLKKFIRFIKGKKLATEQRWKQTQASIGGGVKGEHNMTFGLGSDACVREGFFSKLLSL